MTKLNTYELQILKECAGLIPASNWGGAVGAALETLTGYGFIDGGEVTMVGQDYLDASEQETQDADDDRKEAGSRSLQDLTKHYR